MLWSRYEGMKMKDQFTEGSCREPVHTFEEAERIKTKLETCSCNGSPQKPVQCFYCNGTGRRVILLEAPTVRVPHPHS